MSSNKPFIYDLTFPELEQTLLDWGEKKFRAKQVWEGLYKNLWRQPEEFTNLSKELRDKLSDHFTFSHLSPSIVLDSSDGETRKTLFHLPDGQAIETVLMSYEKRNTVCVSSQAGCGMGCVFCATGQMGFKRHLSVGEIIEQIIHFARHLQDRDQKLTNVVMMGMGEPFHNYDATLNAIDRLNEADGFNMGARRFTISTVGLIPAIERFTKENRQINLAISLHSSDETERSAMIPINDRYPIEDLLAACRAYTDATHRRITFEYALIDGVNDTPEEAHRLGKLLKGMLCHVNVIPLNPTDGYSGGRSTNDNVLVFRSIVEDYKISCTVRIRRGIDIAAGCGQLANKS